MGLIDKLLDRPVIYEVVPPRLTCTEAQIRDKVTALEKVLTDDRIDAINIPELIERVEKDGAVSYNNVSMPPEDYGILLRNYAYMLKKRGLDLIINLIAPRMAPSELLNRVYRITNNYLIRNVVVVGKEKNTDVMPGYGVTEAMRSIAETFGSAVPNLGGICIFHRRGKKNHGYNIRKETIDEYERIALKAKNGCRFVTSQIVYDADHVTDFLSNYDAYCKRTGEKPVTVFISLSPISSPSLLSLLRDRLDVYIPDKVANELLSEPQTMGQKSIEISAGILSRIMDYVRINHISVPLGLHVEQVGTNNVGLTLGLLERTYPIIKGI